MKKYIFFTVLLVVFLSFFISSAFSSEQKIIVLNIEDSIINPIIKEYITMGIEKSRKHEAQALLIKLDTPGGLLSSTRDIVKLMMEDEIPIIVYVFPRGARAASAGTFITLASHIAVMAPSTNIGAAHPVAMTGGSSSNFRRKIKQATDRKEENRFDEDIEPENLDTIEKKILQDTVAWVRNIANQRNRNVDWAIDSVKKSSSITAEEALELGVIDFIASDITELLAELDNRKINLAEKEFIFNTKDTRLIYLDMNLRQRILNAISHPNIAYILMILGFYALLFEVTNPGFGFPGILGIIFIIFAFYSFQVLPINFAGLGLIILSIILFIIEVLTPTFGLFTVGGLVCMFLGSLILIDSPYEFMQISLNIILPVVIATGGITLFLIGNVLRTRKSKVSSGKEGLISKTGEAYTDITKNNGKVFIHGELWNATSKGEFIKKGEQVEVIEVEGLKLIIKKINNSDITKD